MAKKQTIILTHGSNAPEGVLINKGEVLVQHAELAKDAALWTVLEDGATQVSFPSKAYVDAIDAKITSTDGVNSKITALDGRVKTIEDDYLTSTDKTTLSNAINNLKNNEVKANADAIAQEVQDRTNAINGIDTAYKAADNALQADIDKKLDTATYTEKVGEIDDDIATLKDLLDGYEGKTSVKNAVDSKVAQSAYDAKIKDIEDDIKANADAIAALDADYATNDELSSAVSTLEGKIAEAKTTITEEDPAFGVKVEKTTTDPNNYTISLVDVAKASELTAVEGRVTTAEGKITTLIGSDSDKSVRTIANEELAKQLVPEGAQESLDTLKEIADWIQAHPGNVATMNSNIETLNKIVSGYDTEGSIKNAVDGIQGQIDKLDDKYATDTALSSAVSTLEGKITAAQNAATTKVAEGTDANDNLSITNSTAEDGSVTYTVNLTNVAKADVLTSVEGRVATAEGSITALQGEDTKIRGEFADADALIRTDFAKADTALETKLNGEIAKKANTETVTGIDTRLIAVEGAYVKSAEITDATDNKISASIEANKLTLNFNSMVIDGGTY